jgi:hypothetical protein
MVLYFVLAHGVAYPGGFAQCVQLARERHAAEPESVIKIARARAGEQFAEVVAEIAREGERLIPDGRTVPVSKLRRAAGDP